MRRSFTSYTGKNKMLVSTIYIDSVFYVRYELNMMTAAEKTVFENLFKAKRFYEVSNATYRGWLGFKIAAVGSEDEVFNNILAAKTVTKIPRAKRRRLEGPSGAAKFDVTSQENLVLFKSREDEKNEKESRKKQVEEKKKEKEEEREAKKREKEELNEQKRRQKEEKRSLINARKQAAAAKKTEKAAKKAEEATKKIEKAKEKESQKVDQIVPGSNNTKKSTRVKKK